MNETRHQVRRRPRLGAGTALLAVAMILVGCASSSGDGGSTQPTSHRPTTTTTTTRLGADQSCGLKTVPPKRYDHVVMLLEENRTWAGGRSPGVGLGFAKAKMPYLHSLAEQCSYFTDWSETDGTQNSLNQYVGLTSGVANASTVNDCDPSATCRSTDDNVFRQVRRADGTPRTFVDGASAPCSAGTNKPKHIPALYFQGGDDASHCAAEVRPIGELDPDHLPTFAFVVPDQCHDGHDCPDDQVDAFASRTLGPILAGHDYRSGGTLVVVVYDEDRPVPNLLIAPTAHPGPIATMVASHASLLKTVEEALGLPVLAQGQLPAAKSLRFSAHL